MLPHPRIGRSHPRLREASSASAAASTHAHTDTDTHRHTDTCTDTDTDTHSVHAASTHTAQRTRACSAQASSAAACAANSRPAAAASRSAPQLDSAAACRPAPSPSRGSGRRWAGRRQRRHGATGGRTVHRPADPDQVGPGLLPPARQAPSVPPGSVWARAPGPVFPCGPPAPPCGPARMPRRELPGCIWTLVHARTRRYRRTRIQMSFTITREHTHRHGERAARRQAPPHCAPLKQHTRGQRCTRRGVSRRAVALRCAEAGVAERGRFSGHIQTSGGRCAHQNAACSPLFRLPVSNPCRSARLACQHTAAMRTTASRVRWSSSPPAAASSSLICRAPPHA
jgi:hypothetical protein